MRIILAVAIMLTFFVNVGVFVHKINSKGITEENIQIIPPDISVPILDQPLPPQKQPVVPTFVDISVFRSTGETGTVYNDVLSHSPTAPFGNEHGRSTNVHETAHGIHSYLRNKYNASLGKRVNGFYVLQGRGVIVEEPNIRKSQINKFVPEILRSYRFDTYLQKQEAWDDTPLYIYDEWVAYVLGGRCNVDDVKQGNHKEGWKDGVSGCLGFSIYAIATAMAVHEHDPEYWENNKQFKDFTIWMLRESYETFLSGRNMEEFRWQKQEDLLNNFLTSSEAEPMRKFVKEHLDGIWMDAQIEVFFVNDPIDLPPLDCDCHFKRKF